MEPKEWMKNKNKVLEKNDIVKLWQESLQCEKQMLTNLNTSEAYDYMVSKLNYCQRKEISSCKELGIRIQTGDICFIDYGSAYLCEIGYLHFGLILSLQHGKAFIVPVSGNYKAYCHAYAKDNLQGRKHLMRLGWIKGLNKPSVLYINDAKWINTARIIDVKAHIDVQGELFKEIKIRIKQMI